MEMEFVKITGIVALIIFLVAYVGDKTISWFVNSGNPTTEKIDGILGYIATGTFGLAAACGIIHLFA